MVRLSSALCAAATLAAVPAVIAGDFEVVKRQQSSETTRTRTRTRDAASTAAATGGGAAAGAGTGNTAGGAAAGGVAGAATSFTGSLPASVLSIVNTISSGTPSVLPTFPLPTTATAGQTNSYVSGAPPLPAATGLTIANYPQLDRVPPTDSPEVQQWLSQINLNSVPQAPLNTEATCTNTANPNYVNRGENGICWWTCGACTRKTDIVDCPDKNTWGVSYDDGPSPYTPLLLDYFSNNSIKSTFFIVGSRALSRPDMLQAEYMSGHQISVHTWSHMALTTLTNEQIVAELGWTKKVIKDITGVTPNTMRPPYGDIDDRVRSISLQMGLTPIIWTTAGSMQYDTNDWKIGAGTVSAANSAYAFEQIIRNAPNLSRGYIVLSHDLYQQSVDLSVKVILPFVAQFSPKQTLKPIINCLGQDLRQAYNETADTKGLTPSTAQTANSGAGSNSPASASSSSSSTKSAATLAVTVPFQVVVMGAAGAVAGAFAFAF